MAYVYLMIFMGFGVFMSVDFFDACKARLSPELNSYQNDMTKFSLNPTDENKT